MLPIRLGMVNANGPQELYRLRADARRPCRDHQLPNGEAAFGDGAAGVPEGAAESSPSSTGRCSGGRSRNTIARRVSRVCVGHAVVRSMRRRSVGNDELRRIGVFWEDGTRGGAPNVFLTRLHVRYDGAHFPEDLVFQETADRANFQGRYVLRHAWKGQSSCDMADSYQRSVRERREQRGPAARLADRLEPGRDPQEDGSGRRGPRAGGVVAANLEELVGSTVSSQPTSSLPVNAPREMRRRGTGSSSSSARCCIAPPTPSIRAAARERSPIRSMPSCTGSRPRAASANLSSDTSRGAAAWRPGSVRCWRSDTSIAFARTAASSRCPKNEMRPAHSRQPPVWRTRPSPIRNGRSTWP